MDLVISDIVLPGMRGGELAERLREQSPDLRLLFISGHSEEAVQRQGALVAGSLFLHKPFTVDALALKVSEALGTRPPSRVGAGHRET